MRSVTQSLSGRMAMLLLLFWLVLTPVVAHGAATDELPAPAAALLAQVRELMNQKNYQEAIRKINAFQGKGDANSKADGATGRNHPVVNFVLGNCHLLKNEFEQAKGAFNKALAADPDYLDALLNLAVAHYELKAYSQAARSYAQAYTLSGAANPEYLFYSATAYLLDQKYEPAIDAFEKLFKNHPQRVERSWRENYAHALMTAGRQRQSLPVVKVLAETASEKDKPQWYEALLNLYMQLNMPDQAVEVARYLAHVDYANAKWWKALAHVHLAGKNYRGALTALTIYGYLQPLSTEEQKLAADLCLLVGVPGQAIPLYHKMLANNPQKSVLQNLIAAYRQADRVQEALTELERYNSSHKDAEFVMIKADLLYSLKRFGEAESAYRQAAQAGNDQAGRAWLMAGYAAWQTSNVRASRQAFEKAAQYRQQRTAALQAMAQLSPSVGESRQSRENDGGPGRL